MVRALEAAALAERVGERVLDEYERRWDELGGGEVVELSERAFAVYLGVTLLPNPWRTDP